MGDRETPDPLGDLGARIDRATRKRTGAGHAAGRPADGSGSALAMGLRIGLELVVGVIVGVGVGWLVDRWLGTRPWGLVGCFFLGVAAGMMNVYRAVTGAGMAAGFRPSGREVTPASGKAGVDEAKAGKAKSNDDWDED